MKTKRPIDFFRKKTGTTKLTKESKKIWLDFIKKLKNKCECNDGGEYSISDMKRVYKKITVEKTSDGLNPDELNVISTMMLLERQIYTFQLASKKNLYNFDNLLESIQESINSNK